MEKLEDHSEIAITSFECNNMKLNTDKCNLLVLGHRNDVSGHRNVNKSRKRPYLGKQRS